MANSKYSDRNFRDIFGDPTDPSGGISETRIGRVHSKRHQVTNGEVPKNGAIQKILEDHNLDGRALPIPFSQSASNHAPAIDDNDLHTIAMDMLPKAKAFTIAEKEQLARLEAVKMEPADIDEAIKNFDKYYEAAKDIIPNGGADSIRRTLKNFTGSDSKVKAAMRDLQRIYPELRSIKIDDKKSPPIESFIRGMIEIQDDLDYGAASILSQFKSMHSTLSAILYTIKNPEKTLAINQNAEIIERLKDEAYEEKHHSHGYQPDIMVKAAKHQLTARHGLEETLLKDGTVGIYNGSSSGIFTALLETLPNARGSIITPEYHWDGYDALTSSRGIDLKEVPRSISIGQYLQSNYEEKGIFSTFQKQGKQDVKNISAILITNPCSITGREYDEPTLRSLLATIKQYKLPLIINEMHAGPNAEGKIFDSITRLPEYKAVADQVVIIGSISKTCNISEATPKFSYFHTANTSWAKKLSEHIRDYKNRPFVQEDIAHVSSYLNAVTQEYWANTAAASTKKREQVEAWMADTNASLGMDAVKWHLGKPDKGYMAAIEFSSDLLKKAGVHNSLELFEYLYKVGGVSTGEVIPSSLNENTGGSAIRINYGLTDENLKVGLALMKHAATQMQKGVSLSMAREHCPDNHRPNDIMSALLSQMFGGGNFGIQIIRGDGQGI
jgi:aspartate/methionine/tyrosine aminotransferase